MDTPRSFWDHVEEFRKTLIRILCVIAIGMFCSFLFYKPIFSLITHPIHQQELKDAGKFKVEKREKTRVTNINSQFLAYRVPENIDTPILSSPQVKKIGRSGFLLPPGQFLEFNQPSTDRELVILSPPEGLTMVLKMSFWVGLVGTSPFWMFLILRYIAPALQRDEKKILFPFFLFSLLFLTLGFLFAFFVTIPTANHYLTSFNQGLGLNLWTLSHYIDYTLILLLANALAFEIFAILFILVHYGWVTETGLKANRKVVYIGFLVLSALLTPPDALTQLLLALPLMAFYEAAILYSSRSLQSIRAR